MSPDKLNIALMSGLSDSLTLPCLAVAALLVFVLVLLRDERSLPFRCSMGFISGHFTAALLMRAGALYLDFKIAPSFLAATLFYAVIGVGLFIAGSYCAFEWYRVYRFFGGCKTGEFFKIRADQRWVTVFATLIGFFMGSCCSFFVSSWPSNAALLVLSGDIFLPGILWPTAWCLFFYEFVIVFVLVIFFLLARYCFDKKRRYLIRKHRSLLLAISAGVYMSFGVGLVSIFIKQLF